MKKSHKILSIVLASMLFADVSVAQTIAASRTIRSKQIISPADLVILDRIVPGAMSDILLVSGLEARTILYPGRPIHPSDVGPPALVTRNQIVSIVYISGRLSIRAEGRALGRAGKGERVRVMNLSSRTTVSGVVTQSGEVRIIP